MKYVRLVCYSQALKNNLSVAFVHDSQLPWKRCTVDVYYNCEHVSGTLIWSLWMLSYGQRVDFVFTRVGVRARDVACEWVRGRTFYLWKKNTLVQVFLNKESRVVRLNLLLYWKKKVFYCLVLFAQNGSMRACGFVSECLWLDVRTETFKGKCF